MGRWKLVRVGWSIYGVWNRWRVRLVAGGLHVLVLVLLDTIDNCNNIST
jgi:hypothetical protein